VGHIPSLILEYVRHVHSPVVPGLTCSQSKIASFLYTCIQSKIASFLYTCIHLVGGDLQLQTIILLVAHLNLFFPTIISPKKFNQILVKMITRRIFHIRERGNKICSTYHFCKKEINFKITNYIMCTQSENTTLCSTPTS
jgi:hypothetical protein